jgi:hypothetical protein
MKKLLLTAAIAALGFTMVNAQGLVQSKATNSPGGVWVQSNTGVTLHINDIITISAPGSVTGNFITPADLSAPKVLGTGHFEIQSNRVFDVVAEASADFFTASNFDVGIYGNVPGDNTNMPAQVLSMKVTANNTSGGNSGFGVLGAYFSPLNTDVPVPISTTTPQYSLGNGAGPGTGYGPLLILDGYPGGNNSVLGNTTRTFDVSYSANPGWRYAGGDYALSVVYTAAQE